MAKKHYTVRLNEHTVEKLQVRLTRNNKRVFSITEVIEYCLGRELERTPEFHQTAVSPEDRTRIASQAQNYLAQRDE